MFKNVLLMVELDWVPQRNGGGGCNISSDSGTFIMNVSGQLDVFQHYVGTLDIDREHTSWFHKVQQVRLCFVYNLV